MFSLFIFLFYMYIPTLTKHISRMSLNGRNTRSVDIGLTRVMVRGCFYSSRKDKIGACYLSDLLMVMLEGTHSGYVRSYAYPVRISIVHKI
ncbi:hypothetical protein ASPBRDRAFT_429371 [Aspergillus brasiliensis CBS 101740]|uniref:Uncharacterized protein n=1 Tax=Aspergillus brasiliensis (strain CBS 101740 / IMI 381727 / IBT 21946) TaxID=767769 RepID=A0A1L9U378_ASPBC|nr:hypothetical protein ASPBRDRAFT_429371 [Aspergillus brasiliensis CBS 101740]